ncbi:lipase 3 isoform X2 [Zeugodacus cucurbitae]|uniref:lipase 3 isoform X2 n=1 Tax=Zeugodacus cucurbitae TaxID=28588 RepID=UPI0023D9586B|nr:lipase 3 isoform X2 [Zeugodacus cucurbitae]
MNMPLNHFPIMHSTRRKCQLSHLATLLLTLTFALRVGGFNSAITNDLVCRIITSNQYACERHLVRTADNYELTLHRIPPKNSTQSLQNPPFILMHGLLGSASDFLLSGRKRSLACILHEQGYDVWLPNARGTTYSKRHLYMDSSNSSFWNFTWHEIGYYDLPAVVDYVREATAQQQVHFVAHSQGSTVFLVLLSERPEYNEKFASVSLLAPVAFLANLRSPPFRIMTAKIEEIESLFPRILETTPAGISRNQLKHFGQLIRTGKFQKFDYYSKDANFRQYKQPTPPQYNLRNVRVPLQLFFGTRDLLLTKEDAIRLTKELKNTKYTLHELRGFNHIDLLYSSMAPRLVYKHIVNNVKNVTLKSGSKV